MSAFDLELGESSLRADRDFWERNCIERSDRIIQLRNLLDDIDTELYNLEQSANGENWHRIVQLRNKIQKEISLIHE